MFSQLVTTSFVGEVADELFPKIKSSTPTYDDSFLGTARVLLAPRVKDLDVTVNIETCGAGQGFNAEYALNAIEGDTLRLFGFQDAEEGFIDSKAEELIEAHPQFQRDMKTKAFFAGFNPKIWVASLLDTENHITIILSSKFDIRTYHAVQSAMPRFFPWFFAEEKATPAERALLLSLCHRVANTQVIHGVDGAPDTTNLGYVPLMTEMEAPYDFRGAKIRKLIPTFLERSEQIEIDHVRNQLSEVDRQYVSYEDALLGLVRQRRELEIRLAGLNTMRGHTDDKGLSDWFGSVKNVELLSAIDGKLNFEVYTNLEWWDEDLAMTYIDNINSDMYSKTGGMKKETWKVLMLGIFAKKDIKIRTCAAYEMTIGETIRGMSRAAYSRDVTTRIPNAHIHYHGCTGDYRRMFRDAIQNGDYVLALETAVTSAQSIAFNDISFVELIRDMADSKDKKYLEDKAGNLYTPSEAIKYLKKLYKGGEEK